MIDLEQLEADRQRAAADKADLFDFYHQHWPALVEELRKHRERVAEEGRIAGQYSWQMRRFPT